MEKRASRKSGSVPLQTDSGVEKPLAPGMQLATAREVAAFLRLKERTVCRLAMQGRLPGLKLGKSWRFDMGEIARLLTKLRYAQKDRPDGNDGNTE